MIRMVHRTRARCTGQPIMNLFRIVLSAEIWIYIILLANIYLFYYQDDFYKYNSVYSIQVCQRMHCMLYSMFLHADFPHIANNMISFLVISHGLFMNTKRRSYWNYMLAFFVIFFISGIVGASSNITLDTYFQQLWKARLDSNQRKVSCNHWLCKNTINLITKPVATAFTYAFHSKEFIALKLNQFVPRIGASGGVYGLFGARIFTGLFSNDHFSLSVFQLVLILFVFGQEIMQIPLDLEALSRALWEDGDMIDHLCHVASFFTGFILAALLQLLFLFI